MEVKVFNYSEKKLDTSELDPKIWETNFHPSLISLYNRYILLNRRNVISKTKNKAEVSGGGKKPWAQKGTGRARQGSIRSPQWVGGGVVFGPTGRQNYSVEMNKKEKKQALLSILSKKVSMDKLVIIKNIKFSECSTKEASLLIKAFNISGKNVSLILSLNEFKDEKIKRSFRNIKGLSIGNSMKVDVTKMINSNFVVLTTDSLSEIENMFSK